MVRGVFRLIMTAFAVVGFLTVGLWAFRSGRSEPKPEHVTFTPSPNGKYKATLATWAGGGGLSPYCYNQLSVSAGDLPQDMAIADKLVVFAGECDTFSPSNGIVGNSPRIEWDGDTKLKITLSIHSTALSPAAVKLRKQDISGAVAVEFEVRR